MNIYCCCLQNILCKQINGNFDINNYCLSQKVDNKLEFNKLTQYVLIVISVSITVEFESSSIHFLLVEGASFLFLLTTVEYILKLGGKFRDDGYNAVVFVGRSGVSSIPQKKELSKSDITSSNFSLLVGVAIISMALRLIGVLVIVSGSTSFMPRFRLYASTILISVVLFIPYFLYFLRCIQMEHHAATKKV